MDAAVAALTDRLRHGLIPAALTPMDAAGRVDAAALEHYATRLAESGAAGVAVWAHTGRGRRLSESDRVRVLGTFRRSCDLPIVAGAESPRMAELAAEHGADAIMVYPPAAPREAAERDAAVLRFHEHVSAAVDLPLFGFYLHAAAGGCEYSEALLAGLLAMPSIAGVKLATLDRAIACQDAIAQIRAAGKLAVTGEDRMFGPSLMWGADCALVGIAAARVELSLRLLEHWFAARHAEFVEASARMDRFAAATFRAPIEGYVQRMFWTAAAEGLIPERAAHDPYGPALDAGERAAVLSSADSAAARRPRL
ncbi:MAG: dihydrodipicolinate synthase family protein [Stackebrandtia sp.]